VDTPLFRGVPQDVLVAMAKQCDIRYLLGDEEVCDCNRLIAYIYAYSCI
jgi:hypothetical protein